MISDFPNINRLLQKADIEVLIAAGAPVDEYEQESKTICDALSTCPADIEAITSLISIVWARSFDLDANDMKLRQTAIRRLAQEIINTRD